MNIAPIRQLLERSVLEAGKILLGYFGKIVNVRRKDSPTSVVCDADLAAEAHIIKRIQAGFPEDSILAEESGFIRGTSDRTWVIDPLDGTSNFVAGIPWFGAQVGLLVKYEPVAAAMYLPVQKQLYFGAAGKGAFGNRQRLRVMAETDLRNTLCAFGFDASADDRHNRRDVELLRRVSRGVRNVRTTNSLVDFCYTLEGRLGGCVNLNTRIWDILPAAVMLPEAGGKLTDILGNKLVFNLGPDACTTRYEIAGASRALHPRIIRLLKRNR